MIEHAPRFRPLPASRTRWLPGIVLLLAAASSCGNGLEPDASPAGETGETGGTAGAGASEGSSTGTDTGNGTETQTDTSTATATVTDSGSGSGTDTNTATASGTGGGTDRPYANVVAVSVSGDPGDYTFDVSVESADIDCDQFANWWEVLRADGSLVFRRILEHCHTDENGTTDPDAPGNTFTRNGGPVDVAADQTVIVRAHMSNAGYHGQVMRGSAEAGFVEATDIGSDFAPGVETEPPQPDGCLF